MIISLPEFHTHFARVNGMYKDIKFQYNLLKIATCPAFYGEKIYFNSHGFNHLIRKGRTPRKPGDVQRRLFLLKYVETIIKTCGYYSEYKFVMKNNIKIRFWSLVKVINSRTVTVIIRQIQDGRKHFYSIFDR